MNSIEYLKDILRDGLEKINASGNINEYISYVHILKGDLKKKEYFNTFGGNENPPTLNISYNSKLLEAIILQFDTILMQNLLFMFGKYNTTNCKICLVCPLPILIYSPIVHNLQYSKTSVVRLYFNPYRSKKVSDNFNAKKTISFLCLKNTLKDVTPIYVMKLQEDHVKILCSTYFKDFIKKNILVDFEIKDFYPDCLWGFIKGICYSNTKNENEKLKLRKDAMISEESNKAFIIGKRVNTFNLVISDITKMPTWEQITLKQGDVKTYDVNTNFFLFCTKKTIPKEGEFLALQQIHDLIPNEGEESISFQMSDTKNLNITQEECERLEVYHKKSWALKEKISGVITNSFLDGNPDDILKCPNLLSYIIGRVSL